MPPACTPEKHFDAQQDVSIDDNREALLGYVTPPQNTISNTKYTDDNEEHLKFISTQLPKLSSIFEIHKKIGEGTFSVVFLASLHNSTTKKFAVKHLVPTTHPKRIEVELQCLKKIGGIDNVAGLDLCLRENSNTVFIMPYMRHDQFLDYVHDMTVEETSFYMKNLLMAVSRVHSFSIIHRDIKPNNFLYDRKNRKFLLIDFGLAQVCSKNSQKNTSIQTNKRKRDDLVSDDDSKMEPVAKRPALQNKSVNNLNSTILHLQNLTPDQQEIKTSETTSKENLPLNEENADIQMKKSPSKLTKKSNDLPLRKSPFKFPGLDLPFTHSRMTRTKGQRQLFNDTDKTNENKQKHCVTKEERVQEQEKRSSSTHHCKCYGKASICNICLVRKGQDAPRAGTPGFRPPEVLLKYPNQTTAVDIWSVGVMMLCILSGTYPFFRAPDDITALAEMITIFGDGPMKNIAKMFGRHLNCSVKCPQLDLRKICCKLRTRGKNIKKSDIKCKSCQQFMHNCVCIGEKTDDIEDLFPETAYHLLQRLLDINPNTRISAAEALKHPFLNN